MTFPRTGAPAAAERARRESSEFFLGAALLAKGRATFPASSQPSQTIREVGGNIFVVKLLGLVKRTVRAGFRRPPTPAKGPQIPAGNVENRGAGMRQKNLPDGAFSRPASPRGAAREERPNLSIGGRVQPVPAVRAVG